MLQRRRWLPSPVPFACTPPRGSQNFLEVFPPYLPKFQTELRAPLAFSVSRKNYLNRFGESPRGRRWVYADIYAQCIGQKRFSCPRPHIRTYGTRTALSLPRSQSSPFVRVLWPLQTFPKLFWSGHKKDRADHKVPPFISHRIGLSSCPQVMSCVLKSPASERNVITEGCKGHFNLVIRSIHLSEGEAVFEVRWLAKPFSPPKKLEEERRLN